MLATLIELVPYDPVTAGTVTLRACSADDAALTSLNGTVWWPAIAHRPRLTVDGFDGNFGGAITTGAGDVQLLTIPTGALAVFADAPRYEWSDKRARIWTGQIGAAWGSFTLLFDGLVQGNAKIARGRVSLGLKVNDSFLDRPLLNLTYGGTGGADGPAALKGTPKPLIIGAPQFVEPVLIDAVNNVYQLSGYGAIHGVTALFDRIVAFGSSLGDSANYAALIAASIPAGSWRTCLAEGLIRLGAPPAGTLTAHAEGDSGSAYGWVRKPGAVISRLASIAGATGGQIDATSMTALDTAVPYNLSLSIQSQTSARDIIQKIAASANAAAGVSWLGKLYAAPVAIGTSALTLKSDGTALPPVAAVESLGTAAPYWRMQMAAAITWRVHGSSDYGIYDFAEIGGTTKPDDNADVTAAAQIIVTVPALVEYAADYLGTVIGSISSESIRVARGGTSIKTATGTTYSITLNGGVTAGSVDNTTGSGTKGDISGITLGGNSGSIDCFVTVDGVAQPRATINFAKRLASPPSVGGSGSKSAFDSTLGSIASTSYVAITDVMTVTIASGESLYGTAPLDYEISGTTTAARTCTAKWQYSVAGANSWNDFTGSSITGSTASSGRYSGGEWIDPNPGYIAVTQTKATPGVGDWDVRIVALNSVDTARTMSFYGTATIEAKV